MTSIFIARPAGGLRTRCVPTEQRNAHFLRGLLRSLGEAGQDVAIYEPDHEWSIDKLREGMLGERSFHEFEEIYPNLNVKLYRPDQDTDLQPFPALQAAGGIYGGYLPKLDAQTYAESRLTVHVPRQQRSGAMTGIPTIRVFEALACGIPLISAPWQDTEGLFRKGDFLWARDTAEMIRAMELLLTDEAAAQQQIEHGLDTIMERHTCGHRAQQLLQIAEELFD